MMPSQRQGFRTRFAPSPTGHLHLGSAYAALFAWQEARKNKGQFLLRIEDLDFTRCRPEFTDSIIDDLKWLGIDWDEPIRFQSQHKTEYKAVQSTLFEKGFLYPCICTRKEIAEAVKKADMPIGPEGYLYPGTCKYKFKNLPDCAHSLRLDSEKVEHFFRVKDQAHFWQDVAKGFQKMNLTLMGDAVLQRKDTGFSYHIAVSHDDFKQKITHVIRGFDLFDQTSLHLAIIKIMGWPDLTWHHHPLLLDPTTGKKYSKINESLTLKNLRSNGLSVKDIKHLINKNLCEKYQIL